MRKAKRKRLEAKGWKVGTVQEFLNLTPEEVAYVELRLKLGRSLRQRRKKQNLTQVQVAETVESSQSRVAKMEAGDPTVSLDLLIRTLFALGTSHRELARTIGQRT